MSDNETTQRIVEGYRGAWTSGDLQKARTFLADDIEFRGSIEQFNDADTARALPKPFISETVTPGKSSLSFNALMTLDTINGCIIALISFMIKPP